MASVIAALVALGGWTAGGQQAPTPTAQTPAAESSSALPASEIDVGAPHLQTIAQGLGTLDGTVVWRVREVSPPAGGAQPEAGGFSFTLQRAGASIISNELTGRRSRLEPGEGYFMAADDPFVRSAVGSAPSVVWVIELVAPDAPAAQGLSAGIVLFTSDIIADYPRGTYDVELMRGVLLSGEVAELPPHTGPALVMVTTGRLQAATEGAAPAPLNAGGGRLASGALTLRNAETQPAVFVVAAIGDLVDPADAPPPAPAPTAVVAVPAPTAVPPVVGEPTPVPPAPEPTVAAEVAPPVVEGLDTDGDGLTDDAEVAYGSDPLNRDYDADGLLDGAEVNQYGSDPLNNDSDGDTLLDGEEANQFGTSPVSTDGDGDGLPDADEIYVYGTGPAVLDTDGDGAPDGEEILIYGTNPLDPASGP